MASQELPDEQPGELGTPTAVDPLLDAHIRAHFGTQLGAVIAENVAARFPGWNTERFKDWVASLKSLPPAA